jgi:hypothetical protein
MFFVTGVAKFCQLVQMLSRVTQLSLSLPVFGHKETGINQGPYHEVVCISTSHIVLLSLSFLNTWMLCQWMLVSYVVSVHVPLRLKRCV